MYEQVSHSVLNEILERLKPELNEQRLRHFYTRLGANFYAIHSLFSLLYGAREDANERLMQLVETLLKRYLDRSEDLLKSDLEREKNHLWFLSEKWVGMALYCDRFADDLNGLRQKLPYLQELGINMLHIMPILDCPEGNSDGGYAVRDYRKVATKFGSNDDLQALALSLKQRGMLLVLDVVVNHTSNEHQWLCKRVKVTRNIRPTITHFQIASYRICMKRRFPRSFQKTPLATLRGMKAWGNG